MQAEAAGRKNTLVFVKTSDTKNWNLESTEYKGGARIKNAQIENLMSRCLKALPERTQ